ncbi:hypothetical protein FRB93_009060 [Tulasnella sp. JGI-2019a]|nr:hypothetical protein FRB93_009060 [Tulasnella sp. JGI-2019a]
MSNLKRPHWKERLLASASASTIKIAGVGKKLRNKVILLRDVFTPACVKAVHTRSGHGWESQFTPPPPTQTYQSLSPAVPKHDSSVSQRIICVRDLNPALFGEPAPEYDWSGDEKDEVQSFVSGGHHRPGKPLSTLPEEEDELEEDMYVDALVMPIEQLQSIPDIARTFGSPDRSRVSPPWMHKQLTSDGSSTLTSLGANPISRNLDALNINAAGSHPSTMYSDGDRRPSYASEDRRTFNSGSSPIGNRHLAPSIRSPMVPSFMSDQSRDKRLSILSGSSFGFNHGLTNVDMYGNSKRPMSANLSVSDSMSTTTNGRRRSASLVMLPNRTAGKGRGSSVTSMGSRRGKENADITSRYQDRIFVGTRDRGKSTGGEDVEDDDDDDDESESDDGETQNYYVFEASSSLTESEYGGRNSVLVLMPVPEDEQRMMDELEKDEQENDLRSKWSTVSGDVTPRSSMWGTAPLAPSPTSRPYSPDVAVNLTLGQHATSLLATSQPILPSKPLRPPPPPPPPPPKPSRQARPQPQPQEAIEPNVNIMRLKPTQTLPSVPIPIPSPAIIPKTLSAPPPPKRTPASTALSGSIPLPSPLPPQSPLSSDPHPQIKKSRSHRALKNGADASSSAQAGSNPVSGNPHVVRVRSQSMRTSTPPPYRSDRAKTPVTPSVRHARISSETVKKSPIPATSHKKHRSVSNQSIPGPSTPSQSRKGRSLVAEDGRVRMEEKNNEFLRSSGRAFQGQSFRAIQVLDEYSGETEVHVGKGAKASNGQRESNGTIRSSISAPSFPSPTEPVSRRQSIRQRPSM